MTVVTSGQLVSIHYTGKLDSGEVFDSSDGREPLAFIVGQGRVIPGFENGVLGLQVGEERTFAITPADAYGDRDEQRIFDVPRQRLGDIKAEIGMQLGVQMGHGQHAMATVTAMSAESVTLDLNHPLAGQTLHFTIRIVEIKQPGEFDPAEFEASCDSGSCQSCSGCGHDHEDEDEDENGAGCGHGGCGHTHHSHD
jgi:FKBP-type peptidyl-prolyl cis-trans isomerase 2